MLSLIINKDIFNCYNCIGTFSFNKKEFHSPFYLMQYVDGKIDIIVGGFFTVPFMERDSEEDDYCTITGKLFDNSAQIKIEEAVISNVNFNVNNGKPTYCILNVYKPVNILFKDEKTKFNTIDVYLTNFLNNISRNSNFLEFNIQTDNYLIDFKSTYDYNNSKTLLYEDKEDVLITSLAKIDLKNQKVDIVYEMNKLTYLMSYATRTNISPVCFNFYNDKKLIKTVLWPALTTKFSNKEKLIEPRNMKYFIEESYPIFLENYYTFSLNIIISIYLESLLSNYVDSGYILLVVALESFLLSHEENCKQKGEEINPSSIKRINKQMNKFFNEKEYDIPDNDLMELSQKLAYNNTTLGEKLSLLKNKERFKSNLNLNSKDYDFPKIRNEIIHTGKVPKSIPYKKGNREINMSVEFARTLFLLDKIILSLLKYNGKFNDYLNKKEISFKH